MILLTKFDFLLSGFALFVSAAFTIFRIVTIYDKIRDVNETTEFALEVGLRDKKGTEKDREEDALEIAAIKRKGKPGLLTALLILQFLALVFLGLALINPYTL